MCGCSMCICVWLVCVCLHVWVCALLCSELTAAPLENMRGRGDGHVTPGARVATSDFLTKEEAGSPQQDAPDVRMNSLS